MPAYTCGWRIIGKVVDASGMGIGDARVRATRSDGDRYDGQTIADGLIAIQANVTDDYHISVDLDRGCSGYYDGSKLVADRSNSVAIHASELNVTGLVIRVPQGYCGE